MSEPYEGEAYVLGRNITKSFARGTKRETAVFSIRLSIEDIARIERLAEEAGKTPAQIVREALRSYVPTAAYTEPAITILFEDGASFATGNQPYLSQAAEARTISLADNRLG